MIFGTKIEILMNKNLFSAIGTIIQDRRIPENCAPAGYVALIAAYALEVPLPRMLHAIGPSSYKAEERDSWLIHIARHAPDASLKGHLTFALKYEGVDLGVLKRLFLTVGPDAITDVVNTSPTGIYARRIWFLYEWLTGETLDLPDAGGGPYTSVIDTGLQYGGAAQNVRRYRVRDNLPGTSNFCPLVFRTPEIDALLESNLQAGALEAVASVPKDIMARAAAFLLLKDSKASYAIEGEAPAQDRIQRWGRAIGEAGRHELSADEFLRLQKIVLGDHRFTKMGFRNEGGFVGEHDRETLAPIPDHISARAEDLNSLIEGMIAFDRKKADGLDPVIAAAILAFGFVYIHPFEDGNGRIHRYLIHHALAQRGFNPPGVVFPVSGAILERIDEYRRVLESYSARLLPVVQWKPTPKNNVEVLNDTCDFYRFFDATPHAEFMLSCVAQTITEDLPREAAFLQRFEQFKAQIEAFLEMPDRKIDLLFRFLQQEHGRLSKRAIENEFDGITPDEIEAVETVYRDIFSQRIPNK
jgi:Fic family protein